MTPLLRNARRRRPPGLAFVYAALLLRCLVLLIAIQVSGVGHVLVDAASWFADDTHETSDCDDQPGQPCAPGCPRCHCHHPTSVSVPAPNLAELLPLFGSESELTSLDDQQAPHGPAPPSIYRPPRANLV